MMLLLDDNLSRRIVPFIQDHYPLSTQVALVRLEQADDKTIRQYAAMTMTLSSLLKMLTFTK
jgi:hypothetical protein